MLLQDLAHGMPREHVREIITDQQLSVVLTLVFISWGSKNSDGTLSNDNDFPLYACCYCNVVPVDARALRKNLFILKRHSFYASTKDFRGKNTRNKYK